MRRCLSFPHSNPMQVAVPRVIADAQEHRELQAAAQKSSSRIIPLHNVCNCSISWEESRSSGDPTVRLSWGSRFSIYIYQ